MKLMGRKLRPSQATETEEMQKKTKIEKIQLIQNTRLNGLRNYRLEYEIQIKQKGNLF